MSKDNEVKKDKVKKFFENSNDVETKQDSLIDDKAEPIEVDENGIEIYFIEDFNEPKEKVIEEDNLDYETLEGFNEFDEEKEELEEEEFEEYEGSTHALSRLIPNEGEDNIEYDDDYEGSDSAIAKLGENMDFEEIENEDENKEDNLEYEEYERVEEVDDREYEYIEYGNEDNEDELNN